MRSSKSLNHDHGCTAARGVPERRTLGVHVGCSSSLLCRGTGGQQLLAQRQTGSSKTIGQKAEVTDADEAFGQHVQKEAAQELGGSQYHLTLLATVGVILPTKSDLLLLEGQQAMIGDGHAMGVATEIAQHLHGTAESGLGVDHPVMAM